MSANRICIGTAQLGMVYGISNARGQVSEDEAAAMFAAASAAGVIYIDTARLYGVSEAVIGRALPTASHFRIITKSAAADGLELANSIALSAEALARPIYGLLCHDVGLIFANPELWPQFEALERACRVERVGISVNRPEELTRLCSLSIEPSLIQAPVSLFDQRFIQPLRAAAQKGAQLFVRSAFLQGAVFLDPQKLPDPLKGLAEKLIALRAIAARESLSIAALCLGFVQGVLPEAVVVVGSTSREELEANLKASSGVALRPELLAELGALREDDERIVMPSNWS